MLQPRPHFGISSRLVVIIVASVAALAVIVAVVGIAGWKVLGLDKTSAAVAGCPNGTERLAVTADPSIAAIVKAVGRQYDESTKHCTKITVTAQESADTASLLAAGGKGVGVWIPDSLAWVDRMKSTADSLGRTAPAVSVQNTIATSPVVFAVPAARAAAIAASPPTWGGVLNGSVSAVMANPEASGSSLAGMLALAGHAGKNQLALNTGLIALAKQIPADTVAAFGASAKSGGKTVAVTTEQQVAAFNTANPQQQFTAIYPKDGTVAVQVPYLIIDAQASKALPRLAAGFEGELQKQQKQFADAGYRDGTGHGTLDQAGVQPTAVQAQPASDGTTQLSLYKAWGVLTLRGRMLGVIDTSGSMSQPAGNGQTRIGVFQQAAMGAISRFSGDVQLGLWTFSTDQNGTLPYKSVSPIAPLGNAKHSADLAHQFALLPSEVRGDTGLYDTVLAAVRSVHSSYQQGFVNSVVVITDGVNDDDNSTTTLNALVSTLKKEADPNKPVPVIMIGFGPDTDMAAMKQIAQATGGGAYSATKPTDLGNVLTTALTERSCRPNCGK